MTERSPPSSSMDAIQAGFASITMFAEDLATIAVDGQTVVDRRQAEEVLSAVRAKVNEISAVVLGLESIG